MAYGRSFPVIKEFKEYARIGVVVIILNSYLVFVQVVIIYLLR